MKKLFYTLTATAFVLASIPSAEAQSLLRKLERAKSSIENATRTAEKREERKQEQQDRTNPASVEKTTFHEQQLATQEASGSESDHSPYTPRVGKIMFGKGRTNPDIADQSAFVNTLDLSSPSFFNVYLEDPLRSIFVRINDVGEYGLVPSIITRKYYINDELIATYTDEVDSDEFRHKAVFSDVLVPSDQSDFEYNEMRIGVLAHVFSSLSPGTHKFRAEYVVGKNTPKPSSNGSAAIEYDNEDIVVASGEVDLQIDATTRNAYCTKYGRPKFSKGVIEGQATLEQQLTQLVKNDRKRDPIYMYASDSWKIIRGAFDRIIGREARIYYVFTNESGRCELADFVVHQAYEGNGYGAPTFGVSTFAPAFKFVVCQNY